MSLEREYVYEIAEKMCALAWEEREDWNAKAVGERQGRKNKIVGANEVFVCRFWVLHSDKREDLHGALVRRAAPRGNSWATRM